MADQALPPAGAFVDDALVALYGETIDQLIADFGRFVTLYLLPSTSGCPNCEQGFDGSSQGVTQVSNPFPIGSPFNRGFPDGGLCPVCNGTHKIVTPRSVTYKTSIQRTPQDFDYNQWGKDFDPGNVIRLKNKLATFDDIKQAKKALVDGDLYKPLRYPIKTGLRDLRYVQHVWMRVDL